jgi:putative serine protease PepD
MSDDLQRYPLEPLAAPPLEAPPVQTTRSTRAARRWGVALVLAGVLVVGVAGCSASATPGSSANVVNGNTQSSTVSVPPSAQDLQQTVINVIAAVEPSVVQVQGQGGQGSDIGSGEIMSTDGYIVTNDHVVSGFSTFTVLLANSKSYPAQVTGEDPANDLAVLKINATGLHPIAVADSSKVAVGEFAIAIGSPLGLTQSATFGIVSALNRTASEGPGGPAAQLTGLIQTSAPINPGNSGGALVNLQGQLIGIPTLGAVDQESGSAADGIGFAIPSNTVQSDYPKLKSGSIASHGVAFLGIQGESVTPSLAQAYNLPVNSGVLITGFYPDTNGVSPAQQAGLQTGDIIVKMGNTTINSLGDLSSFLQGQTSGTKISVSVVHGDGSRATVSVTLGTRPSNAQG